MITGFIVSLSVLFSAGYMTMFLRTARMKAWRESDKYHQSYPDSQDIGVGVVIGLVWPIYYLIIGVRKIFSFPGSKVRSFFMTRPK